MPVGGACAPALDRASTPHPQLSQLSLPASSMFCASPAFRALGRLGGSRAHALCPTRASVVAKPNLKRIDKIKVASDEKKDRSDKAVRIKLRDQAPALPEHNPIKPQPRDADALQLSVAANVATVAGGVAGGVTIAVWWIKAQVRAAGASGCLGCLLTGSSSRLQGYTRACGAGGKGSMRVGAPPGPAGPSRPHCPCWPKEGPPHPLNPCRCWTRFSPSWTRSTHPSRSQSRRSRPQHRSRRARSSQRWWSRCSSWCSR